MGLYGLQGLIVSSLVWFLLHIVNKSSWYLLLFIRRYLDYYKAKPSGNHQLYKVGSNLSADLIRKQYKQASTRVFLSATVAGGSQTVNSPPDLGQREITTTNQGKYWITSDCHSKRNEKCIFLMALECLMSLFP